VIIRDVAIKGDCQLALCRGLAPLLQGELHAAQKVLRFGNGDNRAMALSASPACSSALASASAAAGICAHARVAVAVARHAARSARTETGNPLTVLP
jgi:hypothetical protein